MPDAKQIEKERMDGRDAHLFFYITFFRFLRCKSRKDFNTNKIFGEKIYEVRFATQLSNFKNSRTFVALIKERGN